MSESPPLRKLIYIIDATGGTLEDYDSNGCDESRACEFGAALYSKLPYESREQIAVQPILFCKDLVKDDLRWAEFERRAGFVFLHEQNRQFMTFGKESMNEEPASFDQ